LLYTFIAPFVVQCFKLGMRGVIHCSPKYSAPVAVPAGIEVDLELQTWNTVHDIHSDGSVMIICDGHSDSYESVDEGCNCTFEITGLTLPDETVFRPTETVEIRIGDGVVSDALELCLLKLKLDQKATIVIQSPHTSFEHEANQVPANTTIEYTVHMKNVQRNYDLTIDEKLSVFNKLKERGNVLLKQGDVDRALAKYSSAYRLVEYANDTDEAKKKEIEQVSIFTQLNKSNVIKSNSVCFLVNQAKLICHLNKAMVYKKKNDHILCISECNAALKINADNAKALFRRGVAQMNLEELNLAQKDLERVKELDPSLPEIDAQLQQLAKRQKIRDQKDKKLFSRMLGGLFIEGKEDKAQAQHNQPLVQADDFVEVEKPYQQLEQTVAETVDAP
jgi:tetratricopeptide (TPR) repeat protein